MSRRALLLDILSISIFSFFPSMNPQCPPVSAMSYTPLISLCTLSLTPTLLLPTPLICLAGVAADKTLDYNRSEVTRVLQSPQRDSGIVRAGCWPVIDGDVCLLPLTRDLVHYHLSPSLSITTIYHPALPAPL